MIEGTRERENSREDHGASPPNMPALRCFLIIIIAIVLPPPLNVASPRHGDSNNRAAMNC